VRDLQNNVVGFHLTTGLDSWGEKFVTGFLPRLAGKEAKIEIGKERIIFDKGQGDYRCFPLPEGDVEHLRSMVTGLIEKLQASSDPQKEFAYLAIPGTGLRIIPEEKKNFRASEQRFDPLPQQ
jgi:hypothetical protein